MSEHKHGIAITAGGERRTAYDVARDFIQQQSEGEWGDAIEERDAKRLASLLSDYAALSRAQTAPDAEETGR